jgi:alpha-ribazole phosphatase
MIKLTCIRHTNVDVLSGTCYGQSDVPLAVTYAEEKGLIKRQIQTLRFDKVFSSPLSRCRKLAADLFPRHEIYFDERLKELHFGQWESKAWNEIFFSDTGKYWMDHYLEESCPGGESYPEFRKRVALFLEELRIQFTGHVVLVTHAGVIRLIKSILDDQTVEEIFESFNPVFGGVYSFDLNPKSEKA